LGRLLSGGEGRLLVVMTGQGGGWLPPCWAVKVFDLEPLTDEQADKLIIALDPSLSAEDRAAVRARCDGVPLYIEQLVREVRKKPDDGSAQIRVPDVLYEPLFARLCASETVVPVVEAAGIIGREIDRGVLCSVVDLSEDEVDDVIDQLEDALVLEPWGTEGWRFRHELLREVAAELAPPSVRRGLHGKVADALVHGVGGGDPDWRRVADHYEQAQRFDEAAWAYQQASAAAARRRGALAEARTYLTLALAGLDRTTPGPDRDRREIAVRLERGFIAAALEGNQSRAVVRDFERCLELGGTDLGDKDLVATMVALMVYYFTRADLDRVVEVLEALRVGLKHGRPWLRTVIDASFGVVAWQRGDFDAALSRLEETMAALTAADQIDVVWFQPNDPIVTARLHLALARFVHGDLAGAEAELAQVAHRVQGLGFPQGPFSAAFASFVEIWVRVEAGQPDRAAVLAADLLEQAERRGFEAWQLWGGAQQATVGALAALGAEDPNPTALSNHIATMTTLVDVLRKAGLNAYITFFDSVLARLLIAAGQPDQARARLDTALELARDTGMHFYDAELLRLRAHAQTDPDARRTDTRAALDLARRQGATLFELRAALDDFELRGESARAALADAVSRFPATSAFTELARAGQALGSFGPQRT
jgi:tetratricopeptide (TPR) repeat protein